MTRGYCHYSDLHKNFRGDWDTEGVTVIRNHRENSTIICSSTHLTSFAVLVDVSDSHQVCVVLYIIHRYSITNVTAFKRKLQQKKEKFYH